MKKAIGKIPGRIVEGAFWLSAGTSVLALGLIVAFLVMRGIPAIREIGLIPFLSGTLWAPSAEIFGILPMITASVLVTLGAIILGVPVGVLTALYLAEMAGKRVTAVLSTMVDLLAAIPSVIYGFFGLVVFVPVIDKWSGGYGGNSLLAAVIILGMMILPTIVSISASSLKAVPDAYREASLAMGESAVGTAFRVTLPAAKSGVFAGVVLGIGRAIGETMAVILVAGNTPRMPSFIKEGFATVFRSVRTLTGNIATEMSYASGLHEGALFATALVLLAFIVLINITLYILKARAGKSA